MGETCQGVVWLFYHIVSPRPPRIKPTHGALKDGFFNTPNAACKEKTTTQTRKVFLDANHQLPRAKVLLSPAAYTKVRKLSCPDLRMCLRMIKMA